MTTNMVIIKYPKPTWEFNFLISYLHERFKIHECQWGYFLVINNEEYQLVFRYSQVEVRIENEKKDIIINFIKAINEYK